MTHTLKPSVVFRLPVFALQLQNALLFCNELCSRCEAVFLFVYTLRCSTGFLFFMERGWGNFQNSSLYESSKSHYRRI
jgi:hypothetical protein